MDNRDPILLSRFHAESARVRDRHIRRQYRVSALLVAILIAATVGAMATIAPAKGSAAASAVETPRLARAS